MSDEFISFKDLENLEDLTPKSQQEREKFPCQHCGGTGVWKGGYTRLVTGKCHSCNGKGFFYSSPKDRMKAKQQRRDRAVKKAQDNMEAFKAKSPELYEFLTGASSWNNFAVSLLQDVGKYGHLTEGQERAAYKTMAKCHDREVAREKAKQDAEKNAVVVDLAKINELIETAKGNGLKRPKLRVDSLEVYPAKANSKNAGFLYVKENGSYAGKISPEGKFTKSYEASETVQDSLVAVAKDPMGALTNYGRVTGNCACCGRELTNQASIDLGIGPICAKKYGLM